MRHKLILIASSLIAILFGLALRASGQTPDYMNLALQVSPDGQTIAVGTLNGELMLYDSASGNLLRTLQHDGDASDLEWSSDGQRLAVLSFFGSVSVWDIALPNPLWTTQLNSNGLVSIDWSPDGNSVAVSGVDIGSVVLDSETGSQTLRLVTGETYDSQWNPSEYLITSSLSGLRLWDGDTELVRILGVVDSQVSDNIPFEVALSVNSESIAVLGTGSIYDPVLETSNLRTVLQVYNVVTLDLINSIYLSSDIVPSKVEWSETGTYLAIGSQDGYIRVWEVTSLTLTNELYVNTGIYAFDWLSENEIVFVDNDSELKTIQIQNGSSPTLSPTPTSTPTQTATPAPFQRLRLTSLCSDNPAQYRIWRVRNFNADDVVFTWDVYNSPSGQNGFGVAPAASGTTPGVVTFITQTEPGANTVRLFVDGAQQDVKASSSAQC